MNHAKATAILDEIMGQITGYKNTYSLEQFMQKFAFDIRLPQIVTDSTTNEQTWSQSVNPTKFITKQNSMTGSMNWEQPKRSFANMDEILQAWDQTNFRSTERYMDSENVAESDSVVGSQFVFRSQDIHRSKNVLFCDSIHDSENVAASQRSSNVTNSVRVEDSDAVANSFNVVWAKKISNSLFINDCFDMYESMFCSHLSGKRFCVANVQLSEEEYYKAKEMVMAWLLNQ